MPPDITISTVNARAVALGFKFIPLGGARYKVVYFHGQTPTGFGYQGNLAGCFAYLQGWAEYAGLLDSLSFHG